MSFSSGKMNSDGEDVPKRSIDVMKGDPQAIVRAVVVMLQALAAVLDVDLTSITTTIEKLIEDQSENTTSDDDSTSGGESQVPGRKRQRRQKRVRTRKVPRAANEEHETEPGPSRTDVPVDPRQIRSRSETPTVPDRPRPPLAHERHQEERGQEVDTPRRERLGQEARVPPIVLRKKDMWSALVTMLRQRSIVIKEAKYQTLGVRIIPKGIEEYRKIVAILDEKKWEYHTYQLPEEKTLRVVIRGIPQGVTDEEVLEDLKAQGFNPLKAARMTTKKDGEKTPLPLVMVQLPRDEKRIFDLRAVVHLRVRVETLKSKAGDGQCYNCQKFGHAQNRCHAAPKCVKCGEGHPSRDCTRKREVAATCANCNGAHPASFGKCPDHPSQRKTSRMASAALSYAGATSRKSPSSPATAAPLKLDVSKGGNPSVATVVREAFYSNMERVVADLQVSITQMAESLKRAQQGAYQIQ